MARIIQEQMQRHPEFLEQAVDYLAAIAWNQS